MRKKLGCKEMVAVAKINHAGIDEGAMAGMPWEAVVFFDGLPVWRRCPNAILKEASDSDARWLEDIFRIHEFPASFDPMTSPAVVVEGMTEISRHKNSVSRYLDKKRERNASNN